MAAPNPLRPRQSAREFFDHLDRTLIEGGDDEVLAAMIEMAEDEHFEAIGFRHHAAATQAREDRHLTLYKSCMKLVYRAAINDPENEEEVMNVCFPDEHQVLFKRLRIFLIIVLAKATPRRLADTNITYSTLTQYRYV